MSVTPPEYSNTPNFPQGQYPEAFTWSPGTDQLWDMFFTDFYRVNPLNFYEHTAYYYELFGGYLDKWVATLSPATTSSTVTITPAMVTSFRTYLTNDSNDVSLRGLSPFLWVYNLLIEIQSETEQSTIYQGNRVSVLTNSQQSAVEDMQGVKFTASSSGVHNNYFNQVYQQRLQIYVGQQQVQSSRTDEANTAIQNTNNLIQQQFSLMSGVISQIQEMVAGIFK